MGLMWVFALFVVIVGLIALSANLHAPQVAWLIVPLIAVLLVSLFGFIVNGPNQARVVQLFGKYVGTLSEVGFFYGNPFYWRTRVSMRVRTFETGMSKTDEKDAMGNVTSSTSSRQPIKV